MERFLPILNAKKQRIVELEEAIQTNMNVSRDVSDDENSYGDMTEPEIEEEEQEGKHYQPGVKMSEVLAVESEDDDLFEKM